MLLAFALWLGLNLLLPPHRVNWPKALDQALSSSVVFLMTDFLQGRVRGWFQKAPVCLPTRRHRPERTPDTDS